MSLQTETATITPRGPSRGRGIIREVLAEHKLHSDDFFSRHRWTHLLKARRAAASKLREAGYSLTLIGRLMNRSPDTIRHSYLDQQCAETRKAGQRASKRADRAIKYIGEYVSDDIKAIITACVKARGTKLDVHLTVEQRTIISQRDRIDELEEEVRQLRQRPCQPTALLPAHWKLTPTQQRMLAALANAHDGYLSHEQLSFAGGSNAADFLNVLRVQVKNLRRAVEHLGIKIINRRAYGYQMTPESVAFIKTALERSAS